MKNKYQKLILFIILFTGIAFIITGCADPVDLKTFFEDDAVSDIINEGGSGSKPPDLTITNTQGLVNALNSYHTTTGRNNETWLLKNGTYNLQVIIKKNLTLIGESQGGVIIRGPADYSDLLAPQVHPTNTAIEIYGLILINGYNALVEATVRNLTVRGRTDQFYTIREKFPDGHPKIFSGIGVASARATIENVVIEDIRAVNNGVTSTLQNGHGIFAGNWMGPSHQKEITITNSIIRQFQKTGVMISINVSKITLIGSQITGSEGLHGPGQNGMQLHSFEAEIRNSTFKDIKWITNADSSSTSVLIQQSVNTFFYIDAFLNTIRANNTFINFHGLWCEDKGHIGTLCGADVAYF
jgi:hypothetical protein